MASTSVQSIVQTGTQTVLQELEAAGEQALADLEAVITAVRTDLSGGMSAAQVETAILNMAESMGLAIVETFASSTIQAIAALLLKALPSLI